MKEQVDLKQYDGSEMDEIKSPPLVMIGLLLGLTLLAFVYVFIWSIVLQP